MTARPRAVRVLCLVTVVLLAATPFPSAAASAPAVIPRAEPPAADSVPDADTDGAFWTWPIAGPRVVLEPYRAPAHAYGAGHRGVDIAAGSGATVIAPAAGVVAFRGTVVDRPLLTVAHADGLVTTFEPVESTLNPGDAVAEGDALGTVSTGGHTSPGALHLGVRRDGAYINPLLLFGEAPRAILLPCCDGESF